eukprot:13677219-Alexandrium_andersonii.AAC.1
MPARGSKLTARWARAEDFARSARLQRLSQPVADQPPEAMPETAPQITTTRARREGEQGRERPQGTTLATPSIARARA